jgi:hypothetical protein
VRADRRRTVSGDVRQDTRIWLSHADSVGRCQVGSGYRVGLQAGGHRFDPGTLHLRKIPFAGLLWDRFPPPATAVRARCERTAASCRALSNEVESGQPDCPSRVTSSSGAGLSRRRSRRRVPLLPPFKHRFSGVLCWRQRKNGLNASPGAWRRCSRRRARRVRSFGTRHAPALTSSHGKADALGSGLPGRRNGAAASTDATTRVPGAAAANEQAPQGLARVIRDEFKDAINGVPTAWKPRSLAGRARSG